MFQFFLFNFLKIIFYLFGGLYWKVLFCLFVCLFLCPPSFKGNWVSLMGFSLTPGAGVDGNAPYQAQELQLLLFIKINTLNSFHSWCCCLHLSRFTWSSNIWIIWHEWTFDQVWFPSSLGSSSSLIVVDPKENTTFLDFWKPSFR